jgi:glycine betaine catabolism B
MINLIDNWLNRITMYRLVLYYLAILIIAATLFGILGILPYDPFTIVFSTLVILAVSLITSDIFAKVFNRPENIESVYITALILALIIKPDASIQNLLFMTVAAILAIATKSILSLGNKHLFNPAAIAVVLTALGPIQTASWWVGNVSMLPLVILGGLLVARKIRREDMIFSFFWAALLTIGAFSLARGDDLITVMGQVLLHSSLFFFAFVMLTEPQTTPPTKIKQNIYAALIGFLFAPQVHLGSFYSTPEIALVIGNIFSYLVSPKEKLTLKLKEKIQVASDTFDFVFPVKHKLKFVPGQYMEWTLPHEKVDSHGSRRYFTLASSPTEDNLRIGVKINEPTSSYKKALLNMGDESAITTTQRAGDFTLPKNKKEKLVFIAGGIGITPFRSMIKYLIDTNQERDIVLLYSNRKATEIAYKEIFDQAQKELKIRTIYTLTDTENIPADWRGEKGRISDGLISKEIPDFNKRTFFLSGPHNMVTGFETVLKNMGVKAKQIKTDYFPGFV